MSDNTTICDRCACEVEMDETQAGQPGTEWVGCTLCNDCYAENGGPPTDGPEVLVVDDRTEEQWCQEACRIGAYDYVEVIEGVKGRWIRTFGERTPEKIAQAVKSIKAQAERYDRDNHTK